MRRHLLLILVLWLTIASLADGAMYTVTPVSDADCSDYQCDLQSAVNAAASNGQDDTIMLASGTYTLSSTLAYFPTTISGENFPLTIVGAGTNSTIIEGGSLQNMVAIDTTGLADGSHAGIDLHNLTLTGTGRVSIASSTIVTLPAINAGSISVSGSSILITGNLAASGVTSLSTPPSAVSGSNSITAGGGVSLCSTPNSCVPLGTPGTQINVVPGSVVPTTPEVSVTPTNPGSQVITITPVPNSPTTGPVITGVRLAEISITVPSGTSVTLDAARNLPTGDVTTVGWTQHSGPTVTISDASSMKPTFVAPRVDSGASTVLKFEHTAVHKNGYSMVSPFSVTVTDNGISKYPNALITFKSLANDDMAMDITNGVLTSLVSGTADSLPNTVNKPDNFPYGVLDMQVKVPIPGGTASVTIFLPAPAPEGYKWFKYSSQQGWYDFSDHAQFNTDRTQVTLTLVDGGAGDDDGVANGVIKDPSGLASTSASGNGGGCFIATAAYGSALDPHVATLRAFRDIFLLNNFLGKKFVAAYYRFSPPIADYIAQHDSLRLLVRIMLLPAIGVSWTALQVGSLLLPLCVLLLALSCAMLFRNSFILRKQRP